MPNKQKLQLLVDALYSGEFKQGRGRLKTEVGYCCLGVACELYHRDTMFGYWTADSLLNEFQVFNGERNFLPKDVADWLGVELDHHGDIEFSWEVEDRNDNFGERFSSAARMNDQGFTFKQIADCLAYEFDLDIPVEVGNAA